MRARDLGPDYQYEALAERCTTIEHTYLADFTCFDTKTIVETKGFWPPDDRRKVPEAVQKQNPDWTIIMEFTNPKKTISKTSRTTYAEWCERHGLQWRQGPE